ncbi:MAG: hypothetical protein KQH63_14930 [Desulfobulbaceae bacterium]|nr:hypothetical protein [Desulfobulbaceae bacterium]
MTTLERTASRFFSISRALLAFLMLFILLCTGCAQHVPRADAPHTLYSSLSKKDSIQNRFCPVFLAFETDQDHNKIGKPAAHYSKNGEADVFIDPEKPLIYYSTQNFTTGKGTYTNIFYRVHFSKVPFSLIPFNLTSGKNVGLYVVITLDEQENPLLITTVHTCGCYLAIVPTNLLPKDSFPVNWQNKPAIHVFGETLPSLLAFSSQEHNRLMVKIGPHVHRVIDLEVLSESTLQDLQDVIQPTELVKCKELDNLPLPDGSFTSFFHESGIMKGYVKGAVKPWETLLMSIIALDPFVGTDKAFSSSSQAANPFYTSLKPWQRRNSNMWDFAGFLKYWGWRL